MLKTILFSLLGASLVACASPSNEAVAVKTEAQTQNTAPPVVGFDPNFEQSTRSLGLTPDVGEVFESVQNGKIAYLNCPAFEFAGKGFVIQKAAQTVEGHAAVDFVDYEWDNVSDTYLVGESWARVTKVIFHHFFAGRMSLRLRTPNTDDNGVSRWSNAILFDLEPAEPIRSVLGPADVPDMPWFGRIAGGGAISSVVCELRQ